MCTIRLTSSRRLRQELERQLHTAQQFGQVHDVKCRLALLAVADGYSCDEVALTLLVTPRPCTSGCTGFCSMASKA